MLLQLHGHSPHNKQMRNESETENLRQIKSLFGWTLFTHHALCCMMITEKTTAQTCN